MLFQKWSDFFRCFMAKSNLAFFAPCGKPSVSAHVKSSLDCALTVTHLSPGECSSLGWMLWKGFSLPWRGSSSHPPLLSSVAFLCCWAHQCILFLSECTKLLIWPLLIFLLSLWWICFVLFLKPNNCLFHLYGELLWLHDVGSQQQLHTKNQLQTFYLLNWCRNNKGIAHICPWNGFWANCPITYGPLKKGRRPL